MATLTLTPKLLDVLCAVISKRKLAINESHLGLCENWEDELRKYYFSLPNPLIQEVGLKKNEACFLTLRLFEIPEAWLNSTENNLHKYTFSY